MPTADDYQTQLVNEIGDPNGTLNLLVSSAWALNAAQAAIDPILQVLYTKRSLIDVRLAEEQPDSDVQIFNNLQDKLSQRWDHLQQMRTDCQAEIVRIEALKRANRVPVTGALTNVTPETPPYPGSIDANDVRFRGDPYQRRGWPW